MFHVWRRTNDVDLASVVSVCVVCLCMAVPQVIAKDCMGPTMDLVFVVDSSRSLRPNEFQLVKQFIAEVVQGLVVSLDDVRVALVRFSTQVHVIAYLDQSTSSADVYESIKNMEYKPGGTNTYGALQKVRRDVLRPERGNRLDVPDVVVVLTDGESWHKGRTVNQALLLREQGVQVVALGIGRRAYMPELKAMTSGVVRLIKKFADLDNVVADIRQSLCSVAEKAAEEMTQNSTRSLSIRPPTATTTSPAMTTSNASRECQGQQIELVFMQDSSVSIDEENFNKAKSFIAEVVRHLPVGPDNVRVALVKYGYKANVITDLSSSSDVSAVTEAVLGMNYVGGGTNTGSALKAVRNEVLNEKRPLARAVLVVITDGANSTRKSTNEAARMLREDDVRMVWLYITQNGTTAMWREKLRMSAAGDTTLEVLTFDDLGQDDVRHILVATCRENFDPDMTTVAPTTAPTTLTSAEPPTSPAVSETSSDASLSGSPDAGLGGSQSSEEPATELGETTGQGDTASSQTVGEEAGQISTNSSPNPDEETVKANATSDQKDVGSSSQPFNQEGQPSTNPSTHGLNETSTADSAANEDSDDESSSPPSTPEQPSTNLTTETDDEALEAGSSAVAEETDEASLSSSTPGQPSTDSTTEDDSEASSEHSDATENGEASTTADADVETPEEDPAATEKGNASSSSPSGPGLPSAANSTTNSDDESATEEQPETSSSSSNPEQPSANATTQADEKSSKADSDTTEQADPSSSTPSSPGQPSGSSTTSTQDDRSEAGSTASEKTGVSPSSTSNPGQPSTNSATEANDDEPSEANSTATEKGDGSPTSPPQGLDSRKPSTDTISGVSKADTASSPTGTARTEMEGEHGAKTQEEGGSSTSVIAGIIVGVLLGAVGVGAVAWFVLWKRKGKTGKDANSCP